MSDPPTPRPPVALRATYRLQLTPDFGFDAARRQIPYLRDLGVSHLYLSPSLQARPGSTHGYDVIDPTRISADLGGEDAFRALAADAHAAGLGIVLDLVPNHMATDEGNRYWTDPELRARFFDLDPATGRHRRFFDIDDLAGVRQEDPEVFAETHRLALSLVAEGVVDALRIDHPDGLADPAGYFAALRDGGVSTVWIEKILESGEALRDWPVSGTVGYEFLNDACAVFVDPAAEPALTALWHEVSGDSADFAAVAAAAKREQASGVFAPEIARLAAIDGVGAIAGGDLAALTDAVADFPVYRTYVDPAANRVEDADRTAVRDAGIDGAIADMLLLERPAPAEFVTRFQQTTPPVVAKGVEDTAFYRYGRLLALNDVGGDPGRFGIGAERFHAANAERARRFPDGMLTTMTHDTKRSGDVRARIAALSWLPAQWTARVREWLSLTEGLRSGGAPDDAERYFIFQTLAGAWPIEPERITQYMTKALREAKRHTNWVDIDEEWERAVLGFCTALYEHAGFRASMDDFVRELAFSGDRITLGTVTFKLTAPGVPDIYQGDELGLRALVDPDNRRPVDWDWSRAMLRRLAGGGRPDTETRKLWLTSRLLGLRIRRPQAFRGGYEPLPAGDDVVAYRRGGDVLVAVATRSGVPDGVLGDVEGVWRDVLYDERRVLDSSAPVAGLLDEYGIAVLERA